METVIVTDVAPRDGLQNQKVDISTESKLNLISLLAQAGVPSVEATSFVSPKAVPQMADADELLPLAIQRHPALRISALIPNLRGLRRASLAGAREVAVVLAATETMNQKNIGMGLEAATEECERTLVEALRLGLRTRAYVGVAFDCPFEGKVALNAVLDSCARMRAAGAHEIVVADTIGSASPSDVRERFGEVLRMMPAEIVGAHFHDTRGMGAANAWAALQVGVRRFDASVGGIGGCPFAPGAAGNVATEDLVLMAMQCGFETGIDLSGLLDAVAFAEKTLGRDLGRGAIQWLRRQQMLKATKGTAMPPH